jgi:Fur family transcriptional regulator, ferric uptake regulator
MPEAPERPRRSFEDADEVIDALREAGHRVSAPARSVLAALFAADGPASAEHIAGGLGGALPALELTSVYRNLERLQDLGVVTHLHVGHGPGLYALARGEDAEYLVCERCHRVTTVPAAALDPVREELRAAFGHNARFSHFPIHGYCASCAGSTDPPPSRKGGHVSHHDHDHDHEHDHPHAHEHSHGDVTHSHAHSGHDHDHVEHEHEHSHGDHVHSHPHVHEAGLEHDHEHDHEAKADV